MADQDSTMSDADKVSSTSAFLIHKAYKLSRFEPSALRSSAVHLEQRGAQVVLQLP
jgi:hypothetical protein